MALWTPYTDDSPLDLSKPAIKDERLSPVNPVPIECSVYDTYTASVGHPGPVFRQPYQPAFDVGSAYDGASAYGGASAYWYASAADAGVPAVPDVAAVAEGACFPRKSSPLLMSPPGSLSPVPSSHRVSMEVDDLSDDPAYQAFERNSLRLMAENNGGFLLGNNPKMRRAVKSSNQDGTDYYKQQRERNNLAAKLSRDKRKMREIRLSLQVSFLKKQMAELNGKLAKKYCDNCQRL